jgi:hypothetical protein
VQKPLAAGQGKTVPVAVLLGEVGQSVPGGPPRPWWGEISEADGGGVVSSGSMFGSTQCLRKLLKKNFRRKFLRIQKLAR